MVLKPIEPEKLTAGPRAEMCRSLRWARPIRGPKLEKLSYFAIVEKGEDTSFEKLPVILTLCKGKQGYYWPGTGAEFTRTKSTRALVAKLRPELSPDQQTFEQCRPEE